MTKIAMKLAKGHTFPPNNGAKSEIVNRSDNGGGKGDAFEINGVEGKTIVVGIRMDSQSRELLTWALVNAAVPCDRVVALHVLSGHADPGGNPAAVLSLAKDFEDMLSVYEGVCNLKQIDLKLKICKGSSTRKVLVREAIDFGASKLILGVAIRSCNIGSSAVSIAKYCAKKLASNCSVLALRNGKIVFQRETSVNKIGPKSSNMELSKVVDEHGNELYYMLPGHAGLEHVDLQEDKVNGLCNLATDVHDEPLLDDSSPRNSCSICSPRSPLPSSNLLKHEYLLASIEVEKSGPTLKSPLPARTHWPSLRRFVLTSKKSCSFDKPKSAIMHCSVTNPHGVSSVHQAHKVLKSVENQVDYINCGSGGVHVETTLPQSIENDLEWKLLESLKEKYSSVSRLFSFDELKEAALDFSPEMLIGTGGSSRVYKGCLPDGKCLAVKILKASEQTVKEFISEIEILTALKHKNIAPLEGFCIDKSNLILVYNYLSRGSLGEMLHGEKEIKHVLSWSERYKVALGVAEALSYLHGDGSAETVIHRDVKSSNVLLSEDLEPQLSDFGLAKWASKSGTQSTQNDVAGTFGYLAPEYLLYGKANEKVDVYAFGVVLLELLSGRESISVGPNGKENLVMWAKPILLSGEPKQLIDPCLGDDYDASQVERVMLSASLCTRRLNQARPQISVVLKLLKGDENVIDWARLEVNTVKPPYCLEEGVAIPEFDIESHLSLALLDVEDDSLSNSSTDGTTGCLSTKSSVEDYLHWRLSRSSSFD